MGRIFQLVHELVTGVRPGGVYEILLDGPAGTGKTRAALELVRTICTARKFKDVRVLMGRKTLKSMRDTVLVEWESSVLLEKELPRPQRQVQSPHYFFKDTNAEVVCCGFDDPAKILSGQFDVAFLNEAKEISVDDYEITLTRMRNGKLGGWHLVILDTNPDAPTHWLNRRARVDADGRDGMLRIRNRLDDNPRWVDQKTKDFTEEGKSYIGILDRLTGVRYRRYRKGEWCMAEGAIWANFDADVHVVSGELTQRHSDKRWMLYVPAWGAGSVELEWFVASVDWGFRAPGCLQVWGMDGKNRAFMVAEVYRKEKDKDWWADKAEQLRRKYNIQRFVCDSAEPDSISLFNKRMGQVGGYWIAEGVKKQRLGFEASASSVRERLETRTLFFLRDSLLYRDESLVAAKLPECTVDEIPAYEYKEVKDGQSVKEEPRADSVDHGCDSLRYMMFWLEYNNWRPGVEVKGFRPGSYGALLGHDEVQFS
jgi:phage terminase large subunit